MFHREQWEFGELETRVVQVGYATSSVLSHVCSVIEGMSASVWAFVHRAFVTNSISLTCSSTGFFDNSLIG